MGTCRRCEMDDSKVAMTDAQSEAHGKIHALMVEHFDAGVCIIAYESHSGEQATDKIKVTHTGGWATAIGLFEIGRNELLNKEEAE